MTFDGVKRSAQQQVNRALKDHARFDTLHFLSSYSCLAHHLEQSVIFSCETCDVILHAICVMCQISHPWLVFITVAR